MSIAAFFEALENIGASTIVRLAFVVDADDELTSQDKVLQMLLASTIAVYCRKTQILKTIHFEGIEFVKNLLFEILSSLVSLKTLKYLSLVRCPLECDVFGKIMHILEPSRIDNFRFSGCGLENAVIPILLHFIRVRKNRATLKLLDITNNYFSDEKLEEIAKEMNQNLDSGSYGSEDELLRLKEENKSLQIELSRLQSILAEIEKNDAIFVIGENSKTLIDRMQHIEARISQLEANSIP